VLKEFVDEANEVKLCCRKVPYDEELVGKVSFKYSPAILLYLVLKSETFVKSDWGFVLEKY
jgi:hypothetical protein